jgi:peptide deformylase
MALLEIKKAGDPVLKQQAVLVENIDRKIKKMLDDMAETMYHADGVGLAAPQIGIPLQVVVIDVGNGLIELINPVIKSSTVCRKGRKDALVFQECLAMLIAMKK